MNDEFPQIIIERYIKLAQFSCWTLFLRSTTSHSLWIEFGCYKLQLRLKQTYNYRK